MCPRVWYPCGPHETWFSGVAQEALPMVLFHLSVTTRNWYSFSFNMLQRHVVRQLVFFLSSWSRCQWSETCDKHALESTKETWNQGNSKNLAFNTEYLNQGSQGWEMPKMRPDWLHVFCWTGFVLVSKNCISVKIAWFDWRRRRAFHGQVILAHVRLRWSQSPSNHLYLWIYNSMDDLDIEWYRYRHTIGGKLPIVHWGWGSIISSRLCHSLSEHGRVDFSFMSAAQSQHRHVVKLGRNCFRAYTSLVQLTVIWREPEEMCGRNLKERSSSLLQNDFAHKGRLLWFTNIGLQPKISVSGDSLSNLF
jgi:hypothetical protein